MENRRGRLHIRHKQVAPREGQGARERHKESMTGGAERTEYAGVGPALPATDRRDHINGS